jgi:hypothetical protein
MVLSLPAIASAQNRNRDRNDDRYGDNGQYGNNGGYYGNGQYGNNGYYDMRSTIRSLKSHARDFQRQLDRDLDNSRYNGSRREDQINNLAKQFKNAVNDLDNNGYDNRNNNGQYGNYGGGNGRGDAEMQRVFDLASQIERNISRSALGYNSQNIWSVVRSDLQILGRNYGYNNGNYRNRQRRGSGNGNYGNGNGNGNGNGGWNKPSWWPF